MHMHRYSHTAAEDQPWFLVDLRAPHYIDSIRLWNRFCSSKYSSLEA